MFVTRRRVRDGGSSAQCRPDISCWMAGLKYALHRLGIFSCEFSHLAYPLNDDDRRRIDAVLEREREYL